MPKNSDNYSPFECSQSDIDNVMKYFKEDGPSYNWENSRGESVSEFLGSDIKTLYNGGFQFCQTGLIRKVLEATGMEDFNGFCQHPPRLRHLLEQT